MYSATTHCSLSYRVQSKVNVIFTSSRLYLFYNHTDSSSIYSLVEAAPSASNTSKSLCQHEIHDEPTWEILTDLKISLRILPLASSQ